MSEPAQLAKSARELLAAALNALQSNGVASPEIEALAEPIAQAMGIMHRIERSGGHALDGSEIALGHVRDVLNRLQRITVADPVVDVLMEHVASSLSKVNALSRAQAASASAQAPPPVAVAARAPVAVAAPPPAPVAAAAPAPVAVAATRPVAVAAPPPVAVAAPAPVAAAAPAPVAAAPPPVAVAAPPPIAVAAPPPVAVAAPPPIAVAAPPPVAVAAPPPVAVAAPPPVAVAAPPPVAVAAPAHLQHTLPSPQQPRHAPAPPAYPAAPHPAADARRAPPYQPAPQPVDNRAPTAVVDVELGALTPSNFYKGLAGNDVIEHGGIFVATYKIPPIGSVVTLRVRLPGDYEFTASATVRWTREAGGSRDSAEPGFGARITQISPEGRQLVSRFTRNREPLFYDDL
ncbi:PilZ domain-containing protein [Sorangium sp. So ce1389]|uniref:PilZ domain-containing protein n=1 Tax=Sorangium sp. So ce1389 TaxID=3133336 RepID=UPI003F621993